MKNSINCMKNLIARILIVSLILACSVMPVFASSGNSDLFPYLQTNQGFYWYSYNGTSSTITSGTKLGNLLGMLGGNVTQALSQIYSKVNSIVGYVDGIEGYVDGIEGKIDSTNTKLDTSNTHLNAIKGYVDGLEGYVDGIEGKIDSTNTKLDTSNTHLNAIKGYVDGIEGYVDGIEGQITTTNTNLTNIKNAIDSITTYNYTSILNSIKSNTDYLENIELYTTSIQDSIGYGTSGDNVLSKLSSVVNSNSNIDSNTSSILATISAYTANTSAKSRWRSNQYGNIVDNSSNNGFYNINGFAYPTLATDSTSSGDQYRYKINSSNNITMLDGLENLSIIGNFTLSKLYTPNTRYTYMIYDPETNSMVPYKNSLDITISALSIMDILTHYGQYSLESLSKLQAVLADDDTIQAKQANKNQEQSILNNFTGSGGASASVSDIGTAKDTITGIKSGLATGTSASNVIGVFNSDEGYNWFSNTVAQDIDHTNSSTLRNSRGSSTPLLDEKMNALYSVMGVIHD